MALGVRAPAIVVTAFVMGLAVLPAGLMGLPTHPVLGVPLVLSGEALVIQSVALGKPGRNAK